MSNLTERVWKMSLCMGLKGTDPITLEYVLSTITVITSLRKKRSQNGSSEAAIYLSVEQMLNYMLDYCQAFDPLLGVKMTPVCFSVQLMSHKMDEWSRS